MAQSKKPGSQDSKRTHVAVATETDVSKVADRPRMVVYAKQELIDRLEIVAKEEGFAGTGPWLRSLAIRRMKRRAAGAKSFGALRDEREALIRRIRELFNEIEEETDAEDLAGIEGDEGA